MPNQNKPCEKIIKSNNNKTNMLQLWPSWRLSRFWC